MYANLFVSITISRKYKLQQLWRSYHQKIKVLVGWPRQRLGPTGQIEGKVVEIEWRSTLAGEATTAFLCLKASSVLGDLRGVAA